MPSRKRTRSMRSKRPVKRTRRSFNVAVPRGIKSPVMSVARTFYTGSWAFGNGTTSDFWRYSSFSLNTLPNVTEYTALFDEYKINAIKVQYRPSYDSVSLDADSALTTAPNFTVSAHTLIDQESTTLPTGSYSSVVLNNFLENGKVRTRNGLKPFSVFYKPKMYAQVSGSGTAARPIASTWIRTSDTAALHYGHHVFLQTNALVIPTIPIRYDCFVTFYAQFRGMK